MTCPVCHGIGVVPSDRERAGPPEPVPCWECGGCGIVHCCEGERPGNPQDPAS